VVSKVKQLIENQDSKIAILFKGRGKNAEIVETELSKQEIPYFYGMFKDDDTASLSFTTNVSHCSFDALAEPKH